MGSQRIFEGYMFNSVRLNDAVCVDILTIIGSDNGLSPGQRQAIIWTNDRILSIRPLGIRNSYIFIQEYAFEKVFCKMGVILSQPQCVNFIVSNVPVSTSVGTAMTSPLHYIHWYSKGLMLVDWFNVITPTGIQSNLQ